MSPPHAAPRLLGAGSLPRADQGPTSARNGCALSGVSPMSPAGWARLCHTPASFHHTCCLRGSPTLTHIRTVCSFLFLLFYYWMYQDLLIHFLFWGSSGEYQFRTFCCSRKPGTFQRLMEFHQKEAGLKRISLVRSGKVMLRVD